jgi:superfamily I DNA and/or RNA helicase
MFSKRFPFEVDSVVIDEAGQLALASAALVFRSLAPWGRVLIAGDFEQLAPIFSTQYPVAKPRLFGSLLDCMMDLLATPTGDEIVVTIPSDEPEAEDLSSEFLSDTDSSISTIVQLKENFRFAHS